MRVISVIFGLAALASTSAEARAQITTGALLEQHAAEARAYWAAHARPDGSTEPALTGGSILTPNINVAVAPGAPRIKLDIAPGSIGLSGFDIQLISPNNQQGVSVSGGPPSYLPMKTREVLMVQVSSAFANQGFGFYTLPGDWTLNEITLFSMDGSIISYSAQQLSGLFSNLIVHITNPGTPDVTAPTLGKGSVLTPTIDLSDAMPYFEAKMHVADDVSGVATVGMGFAAPDGSFGYGAYSTIFSPVKTGEVIASSAFQQTAPVGTYTINYLSVCDVAGNCTTKTSASDIQATLGTTTFVVKK